MRAAVGIVVVSIAGLDLAERPDPTMASYFSDSLGMALGVSLLAGFLTPIAATLLSAAGVWILASTIALPAGLSSKLCVALLAATAAAIVLLGPGAFSLDARLFGWREIIIPPPRSNG